MGWRTLHADRCGRHECLLVLVGSGWTHPHGLIERVSRRVGDWLTRRRRPHHAALVHGGRWHRDLASHNMLLHHLPDLRLLLPRDHHPLLHLGSNAGLLGQHARLLLRAHCSRLPHGAVRHLLHDLRHLSRRHVRPQLTLLALTH